MFETTIQFKPREQWRPGMTPDGWWRAGPRGQGAGAVEHLVPPIRNRIDMLATGIKGPVGIKVAGTDLATIDRLATQIEAVVKRVPGVSSALAERLTGGRYIDVDVDRAAAARYLAVADVQAVVATAIGGDNVGEVVSGRERFPINVRYPREIRDSLERLRTLPFVTEKGASCCCRTWLRCVSPRGRRCCAANAAAVGLGLRRRARPRPALGGARHAGRGGGRRWRCRGATRSRGRPVRIPGAPPSAWMVVPATLAVIFLLLYLLFRQAGDALLVMAAVPSRWSAASG